MQRSNEISNLIAALAKAQLEFSPALKDRVSKFRYQQPGYKDRDQDVRVDDEGFHGFTSFSAAHRPQR